MTKFIFLFLFSVVLFANERFSNALIDEESPYLLQHAHNPVNWYPWGSEAFELAKEENKLIFVSIGYSTCHWCHVMEEESFENIKIATLLNRNYISIKVDKEEMPHLDTVFQEIHSKLKKRRNGWPLNFIMTPQKELLYITTYIPPTFNYGAEGMNTLIPRIYTQYKNKNKKLHAQINSYKKILASKKQEENSKKEISNLSTHYVDLMKKRYDKLYKGFDKQPKFPLASHLNLLLDIYKLEKNKEALRMAIESLEAMSYGGIFDQIEGGFFRYSVYPDWIIPHFEKMLYTQAELIPVYYKAYMITKNEQFKTTILQTIEATNKIFRNKEGLYYSASDADSLKQNGKEEEGYYFTYTYKEAKKSLLKNGFLNSDKILEYIGFDDFGNFEKELNNPYILDFQEEKPKDLTKALHILKKIREDKTFPFIDKKIITSWNALMIKALFIASNLDSKYLIQAKTSLNSLLKNLYKDSMLYHQKLDKKNAYLEGYLEDYSFLTDTLIQAYQTTYEKKYIKKASVFNQFIEKNFYTQKQWYLDKQKGYPVSFKDKYYTAPISRFFHNSLSLANINANLTFLEKAKDYITEQENRILTHIDVNPEAVRAIIRKNTSDIILKSNKKNLLLKRSEIETIKYPFLLKTIQDTKQFLACDERTCFSYNKDINIVIQAIDK